MKVSLGGHSLVIHDFSYFAALIVEFLLFSHHQARFLNVPSPYDFALLGIQVFLVLSAAPLMAACLCLVPAGQPQPST